MAAYKRSVLAATLLGLIITFQLSPHSSLSPRVAAYTVDRAPAKGWAVVAGGSDGLGKAWAQRLTALGLNLLLIARRRTPLEELAATLRAANQGGIVVETLELDLAKMTPQDVEQRILTAERDVRLVIYNAAATGPRGDFILGTFEQSATAVDVNVRGVLLLTHAFARKMDAAGTRGGVVLMSSLSGVVGSAFISGYAATKSYITTLARGLFVELRPRGIDVLSCVAGATTTPTYLKTLGEVETRKTWIEQNPLEVVEECLCSLGREPSIVTGALNKLARSLFVRLLPVKLAVQTMSEQAGEQMGFALKKER